MLMTFAAWAWSYRASVTAEWYPPTHLTEIAISWEDGLIGARYVHADPPSQEMLGRGLYVEVTSSRPRGQTIHTVGSNATLFQNHLGPIVYSSLELSKFREYFVELPLWAIALVSSVLPAVIAVRWNSRRRRRVAGRCVECGYDLRASKNACPECGTSIPAAKSERDWPSARAKRLMSRLRRRGVIYGALACVAIGGVCLWGGGKWGRHNAARVPQEPAGAGRDRLQQLSVDAGVGYQRRHVLAVESARTVGEDRGASRVQYRLTNVSGKSIAFASGSIQLFDGDGVPIGGVAVSIRDPIKPGEALTISSTWKIPDQLRSAISAGAAAYFWADYVRYDDDTIHSFAKAVREGAYVGPPSHSQNHE